MANPGENVQSSDKRMKDHIEYLTILYSQRPLRQRVKPTQVRPDFYDLRKWGRGNFQNDTGYLYRDKFISEGRYHHVEKQSQIVFQPSYVYATDVNLGCIVFFRLYGNHIRNTTIDAFGLPTGERGLSTPEPRVSTPIKSFMEPNRYPTRPLNHTLRLPSLMSTEFVK